MKKGEEKFERHEKGKCSCCDKVKLLWKWTGCMESTGKVKSFLICKRCHNQFEKKRWQEKLEEMASFTARMENDPYMRMQAAEAKWDSDHSQCRPGGMSRHGPHS